MVLIPEWRSAWRYASVQLAAAAVLFGALPEAQQAEVLALVGVPASRISAVLGIAFIAVRVLAQPRLRAWLAARGTPAP